MVNAYHIILQFIINSYSQNSQPLSSQHMQEGYQDDVNYNASNPYNYQQNQYANMQYISKAESDPLKHLQDGLLGQARKKFIMKVYIILTIQFLITMAMCFISYYVPAFLKFQLNNQWLMWVCFAFLIITQIFIFCIPAGRKSPINIICLFIFTIAQSYCISFICSLVAQDSSTTVVVVAAVMTLAIVLALTVYAIFTPSDFTVKWGIVIVILMAMLMLGIFSIFVWSPFLNNLYCCLGVIVFGIYLVIDTQMIIGGRRLQLSMDDYVIGALILYIDVIQIFLYILELMSKK